MREAACPLTDPHRYIQVWRMSTSREGADHVAELRPPRSRALIFWPAHPTSYIPPFLRKMQLGSAAAHAAFANPHRPSLLPFINTTGPINTTACPPTTTPHPWALPCQPPTPQARDAAGFDCPLPAGCTIAAELRWRPAQRADGAEGGAAGGGAEALGGQRGLQPARQTQATAKLLAKGCLVLEAVGLASTDLGNPPADVEVGEPVVYSIYYRRIGSIGR